MIFLNPCASPREIQRALDLEVIVRVAHAHGDNTVKLLELASAAELRGEDSLDALRRHYFGIEPAGATA